LYDSNNKLIAGPSGDSYIRHEKIENYVYVNIDAPTMYQRTVFVLYFGDPGKKCQPKYCTRADLELHRTCETNICGMTKFDCDLVAFNDWRLLNEAEKPSHVAFELREHKFTCTFAAYPSFLP
jgi:hypothetical protein